MIDEDIDVRQLLVEMTDALEEAHKVLNTYATMLDKLEKENKFLSDTIVQYKLGLITTERRKLINENRSLKEEVSLLMGKIKQLRS